MTQRHARYEHREIFANKAEEKVFSTPRTQEDLRIASEVKMDDKRLTAKLWRHPQYFGLERSFSDVVTL